MLHAVVVNYRTPDDLRAFLVSWQSHAPEWARLTVVNVAPEAEDHEVALASSADEYIQHADNVGYSFACNTAVANSTEDVFAFFNADTRLLDGVLEPLCAYLMSRDDWGIIGPRQVDDHGRITHAGIFGTNTAPTIRGWLQPDNPGFCDIRDDCVSVMGSAYFVKRQCWEELWNCPTYREKHPDAPGAFLPTKHYYEETWCSYHARAHGWKIGYFGLAKMIHRWHKASPVGGFADLLFEESRVIFRDMCDHHGIARD